jgi:hypothetical protein
MNSNRDFCSEQFPRTPRKKVQQQKTRNEENVRLRSPYQIYHASLTYKNKRM